MVPLAAHFSSKPRILVTGYQRFIHQHLMPMVFSRDEWEVFTLDLDGIRSPWRRLFVALRYLSQADLWFQIHGYAGRGWLYRLAKRLGVPVIMYWQGTDVLSARKYFSQHPQDLQSGFIHWAVAPWLVEELKALAIEAQFMPFPFKSVATYLAQEPPPLPDRFSVLTYLSDSRPSFYGWEHILRLAEALPELPIQVIGATGNFASHYPANIHFAGWVADPLPFFRDNVVLVRMPEHDGYPATVEEALALGRYVIWTYPFPGAIQAQDDMMLVEQVKRLYHLHQEGRLTVNQTGRVYLQEAMLPEKLAEQIVQGIRNVLQEKRGQF